MRRECEPAYRLLCELLMPRQVQITVDGEVVTLDFDLGQVAVLPVAAKSPIVSMVMSREIILDLTDAKFTLQGAILDGLVEIHGDLKDLVLFHEGWLTFMRGAIRCPSFPDLLERYRFTPTPVGRGETRRQAEGLGRHL
jgi:hypothetical protein